MSCSRMASDSRRRSALDFGNVRAGIWRRAERKARELPVERGIALAAKR